MADWRKLHVSGLNRFLALFGGPLPSPSLVLDIEPERLRSAGLSNLKTKYVRIVPESAAAGGLAHLQECDVLTDMEIIERLPELKSVGRCTVEMSLIFNLGRPDVLPGGSRFWGAPQIPNRIRQKEDAGARAVGKVPSALATVPHLSGEIFVESGGWAVKVKGQAGIGTYGDLFCASILPNSNFVLAAIMLPAMNRINYGLLARFFLALGLSTSAKEIEFGGCTWTVRAGRGGPGPNAWDENDVWLDSATNLHLKISRRDGKWSCAEITMKKRLGFGRYQFQIAGRIDRLDDNVVLGLFNYPTGDVGADGTHEIDIEFARWGEAENPMGNFTVWPVEKEQKQKTKSFAFSLAGDQSTHRFTWSRNQILFQSLQGHRDDDDEELHRWFFRPLEPTRSVSQQAMPVHINLWLFKGLPPKNRQEVELIIRSFKFTPE